jgi:ABC-type uncharacterized transport system auxiliary subunit
MPRRARVQVRVSLHDDSAVVTEATFDAARPFGGGDADVAFNQFAAAISEALDEVVAHVVELVSSAPPASPAR